MSRRRQPTSVFVPTRGHKKCCPCDPCRIMRLEKITQQLRAHNARLLKQVKRNTRLQKEVTQSYKRLQREVDSDRNARFAGYPGYD